MATSDEIQKAVTTTAQLDPLRVLGMIFIASSLGGVAALLRSNKKISTRLIISAALNSGLLGLVIGLVWWNSYKETNLYFLAGVSLLAGMGGATVVDILISTIKNLLSGKYGVSINIVKGKEEGKEEKPSITDIWNNRE